MPNRDEGRGRLGYEAKRILRHHAVAEGPWSDLQDELEISLVPPGSGVAKYRTGRLFSPGGRGNRIRNIASASWWLVEDDKTNW
jgi:hypothetical protein